MKKIITLLGACCLAFAFAAAPVQADCGGCGTKATMKTAAKGSSCGAPAGMKAAAGCASDASAASSVGTKTCVVDGKEMTCTVFSDGSCKVDGMACSHEGSCTEQCAVNQAKLGAAAAAAPATAFTCTHDGACVEACKTAVSGAKGACSAPCEGGLQKTGQKAKAAKVRASL